MNSVNLSNIKKEEQTLKIYDIAIIGAGPAGLTAAIYALRDNKNVILFEKNIEGGQVLNTPKIDNIPGFYDISGEHFIDLIHHQIQSIVGSGFGNMTIEYQEVIKFTKIEQNNGQIFYSIKTSDEDYFYAKKIILAIGSQHKTLGIEGEAELIGKGISFCVTCDGPFYSNKDVAVIGGGNSALIEALELSRYANHITIIQNMPFLTGEQSLINEVLNNNKIHIIYNTKVTKFSSREDKVVIHLTKSANNEEWPTYVAVDGVFEAIGFKSNNIFNSNNLQLDDNGYYIASDDENILIAGDCCSHKYKQAIVACADGAKAAIKACQQLNQRG